LSDAEQWFIVQDYIIRWRTFYGQFIGLASLPLPIPVNTNQYVFRWVLTSYFVVNQRRVSHSLFSFFSQYLFTKPQKDRKRGIKNNKRDLINELFCAIDLSVLLFSAPKDEKEEKFLISLNVLYRLNDFTRSPKTVTCHLWLQYWLVVIFQVLRDK